MYVKKNGHPACMLLVKAAIGLCLLIQCALMPAHGQKYNFINQNVENGLAQSQVSVFAQDKHNQLLIGTLGGLSIFDGTSFNNYTKSKGLPRNPVSALSCDGDYNIWIGTSSGLSRFDGQQFRNFRLSETENGNSVKHLATDAHNRVWILTADLKLRYFDGLRILQDNRLDSVTAITLDRSGNVWAACLNRGIFVLHGSSWKKEIGRELLPARVFSISFGAYSGTLYCLTYQGLRTYESGHMTTPAWTSGLPYADLVSGLLEDSRGNIWLSSGDGGAWLYSQGSLTHFTYQNGLTDDKARSFFEDNEGNIWIGSDGSGIFRYTGGAFTYYDRSTGLAPPSVLAISQNRRGEVLLAGINASLYRLEKGTPARLKMPPFSFNINSLLTDSSGTLWIGTDQVGLWYNDGKTTRLFRPSIEQLMLRVLHLHRYGAVTWIASDKGLFSMKDGRLAKEPIENIYAYAIHALNADTLLLGTSSGAYYYLPGKKLLVTQPLVTNSNTICFASDAQHIYIGTDDKGLAVWERAGRKLYYIGQRSGLSCDYVYSLLRDRNGNIWVGTGCGIDKVSFSGNGFHVRSFGPSDGLQGVENNANASFEDREGYLWFGTTKGAFRYNPYLATPASGAPLVMLQSVRLFSKDLPQHVYSDSIQRSSNLPWNPTLPPAQNHLTFTFKGIYLSNPENIRYRYQLIGIDKAYTETEQTTVVYPNLPPGSYLFKVWASDAEGKWHPNAVTYPFTINAPYYTTWYFRTGVALLLVGLLLGAVYYRNRQKELRRRWEAQLREKEQALVRKKTAEDFHDEIGNKLTRINLLATIAEGKLSKPAAEIQPILQQIQQQVTSLYNGSKDIIWSLQPESDYLDEIVFRIRQNIAELVQDTNIRFDYLQDPGMDMHIRLPVDHSRNMIMIFKEAANNVLKHAGATVITLSVKQEDAKALLELSDNGKGFDAATVQRGNGLGNMGNRAERIGARLELEGRPGGGTGIRLWLAPQQS